jgi:hypothetical protein
MLYLFYCCIIEEGSVFVLSLLRFPKPWGLDCVVFLVPLESFQSVGGAPSDLVMM